MVSIAPLAGRPADGGVLAGSPDEQAATTSANPTNLTPTSMTRASGGRYAAFAAGVRTVMPHGAPTTAMESCHDPIVDSGVPTVDERGCPSDDELTGFVEHVLPPERRAHLEAHVDRCAICREAVGHVASTVEDGPKQIGRYRLDRKVGAGGMGVVWQAWDPALEREIAIKLIHPELHDALGRERALREARALARLQHPNVVAVHDVGEHEGDVFIATELIDGESLDRWQKGRMPAELLAAYAQAARGLAAAHALGLVHRDVKPSNILVAKDGRVRIGDFGLATNAAASSLERPPSITPPRALLPRLTNDGERLGTPAYMAPEQQHSTAVDARADQFSLCLALTEALLGKQPGTAPTPDELAASGIEAPWEAIARGLATRPSDRFATLAPLVDALEGKRPRRRAGVTWIAGGLVAAAAIGGVAWFVLQRPAAPAPKPIAQAAGTDPARTVPPPTAVLPLWTWTTPTTGPWRLPTEAMNVAIVDAGHAIALNFDEAMVIDLQTGAITNPVQVISSGRIESVVRVGGKVLAFGEIDSKPAAWTLSINPPSATAVPLPDPVPEEPKDTFASSIAVVSGDGTHLAICGMERWPTVRDATSLAVIRVIKGLDCRHPSFPDAGHVVLGDASNPRLVDLATGEVTKLSDSTPRVFPGPGGKRLVIGDESYKILGKNGAVLRERRQRSHYEDVTWTPDGKHVVGLRLGTLTVRPADDGGIDREIDLPTAVPELDVNDTQIVVVAENVVHVVDLANGTVRHATGNLEMIHQVAPRGGGVVVASDKLRLWREGKLVATTDAVRGFAVGSATAPITVLSFDVAGSWDPSTGERRVLRSLERFSMADVIVQSGDTYAFSDGETLFRGQGETPPAPWVTFGKDLDLEAIDLAHGRLAFKRDDAIHIVDLAKRSVWSVMVPGMDDGECDAGLGVRFAPDGTRFAIDAPGAVILFDAATRTRIGDIDLPKMMQLAWDFLPTGELVFVGQQEIAIWDPKTKRAVGWKPPLKSRPQTVAIDPAGTELAIAYANGSVLWADVAQLRAHATHRDAALKPTTACADRKIKELRFDQAIGK